MVGKTHAYSDEILNVLKDNLVGFTHPFHIALFTTSPTDDYTGAVPTPAVEVTAVGANLRVTLVETSWGTNVDGPSIGRRTPYNADVSWLPWNTAQAINVNSFAIMDEVSSTPPQGEMLYYAAIPTPKTLDVGENVTFDSGTIIVQED